MLKNLILAEVRAPDGPRIPGRLVQVLLDVKDIVHRRVRALRGPLVDRAQRRRQRFAQLVKKQVRHHRVVLQHGVFHSQLLHGRELPEIQILVQRFGQHGPVAQRQRFLRRRFGVPRQQQAGGGDGQVQVLLAQCARPGDHPVPVAEAGQKVPGIKRQGRAAQFQPLVLLPVLGGLVVKLGKALHIQLHGRLGVPAILPLPGHHKGGSRAEPLQAFAQRIGRVFQRPGGVFQLVRLPQRLHQLLVADLIAPVQHQKHQ